MGLQEYVGNIIKGTIYINKVTKNEDQKSQKADVTNVVSFYLLGKR